MNHSDPEKPDHRTIENESAVISLKNVRRAKEDIYIRQELFGTEEIGIYGHRGNYSAIHAP